MSPTGGPGNGSIGNTRDGISSRHERILGLLESRGFVSIGGLAKSFAVSEQTVRRDLNDLEKRGLVTRYHGGAGMPPRSEERRAWEACVGSVRTRWSQ